LGRRIEDGEWRVDRKERMGRLEIRRLEIREWGVEIGLVGRGVG
jgi:hypothetical protein